MKTIIKKAINEGGWNPGKMLPKRPVDNAYCHATFYRLGKSFVLDPLFWQALGKACGWNHTDKVPTGAFAGSGLSIENCVALHFHEINLTEGWEKAVQWLESLIIK